MSMSAHSCTLPGCDLSSEPLYEFQDPGCDVMPARCGFCKLTEGVIAGDGPPVCHNCIALLIKIVTHPDDGKLTEELAERHADVVTLERLISGTLRWRWTTTWPGVERRAGGA